MNPGSDRWANFHWPLLVLVLAIGGLGTYNLHSSAAAHEPGLYLTQLTWIALGLGLVVMVMIPDYRFTEGLAYVVYAITCLLLVAVLAQGRTAKGAQRWLVVGPGSFQPSEIAKLAVIFCLARYFSSRVREDGYTVLSLVRPLNPSRPLAVVAALAVFWSQPWLVDPIGELARLVHSKPIAPPGDLLWFRVALILGLVAVAAFGALFLRAFERRRELLDPWPPKRRRRLTVALVLGCAALGVLLAVWWDVPVLRDPIGVWMASLHEGAAAGGPYAELAPGITLRLLLVLAAAAYALASFLSLRGEGTSIDVLIAPIDLLLVPAVLVLVQPDLGTAGMIFLIGFSMILVVGVRLRSLAIMGFLGAVFSALAWFAVLEDYQKRRILTFLDPENDVRGAGWNAVQSMIAVGSGRWWGKGHMGGTQSQLSFLPEQHTDFAFSVWAEEQGFMGCVLMLGLYALLVILAFAVASSARDIYGALLASGVAAMILWQALINVSMVIGVFPVVGITLPLFSYGGTSVLSMMLGIGIVLNVYWRRRAH